MPSSSSSVAVVSASAAGYVVPTAVDIGQRRRETTAADYSKKLGE